ncbi:MAG TPA: response regulator transcription factor [Phaeodactylibacter sp.]|nr:response regulator transcription factor [Phaeodactylibacter sp.]
MNKIKTLYVEDEPYLGKIVKESLESRNFEVKMLPDGRGVRAAAESFQPQICVLDVMLPHKDGFTLGKELRQLYPHLPIIFLTAKNQTKDILKGVESGGNDYVKKPFSMEELIVRINNLLHLSQPNSTEKNISSTQKSSTSIPLGRYVFYPKKFELHLDNHIQKLSHREAQLFQILCNNKNTSVKRKDILLEVWQDDSIYNSRNLDVYITKLRNYLKQDDHLQIITLKGVGYHFLIENG